jgi:hypothetical protein
MTTDEKLAVQTVVVEFLQTAAQDQKTLLLDVLLGGTGHPFVHHVLSTQAAYAQRRADTLNYLLRELAKDFPAPAEAPAPEAPAAMAGGR